MVVNGTRGFIVSVGKRNQKMCLLQMSDASWLHLPDGTSDIHGEALVTPTGTGASAGTQKASYIFQSIGHGNYKK